MRQCCIKLMTHGFLCWMCRDVRRYKNFLALGSDADAKAKAAEMKKKGDFTTPGVNASQIAESKAAGTPADAFLSTNEVQEGDAAAR